MTRVRCDLSSLKNPNFRGALRMSPNHLMTSSVALLAATMLSVAPAAAQTKDHAPVALPSARMMAQDKANTESWTYAQPTSVFTKYRTVIVDPTTVYQGPDAQFDGVDPADRQ